MKIYSKPGSKERLFEMMKGVNGLKPKLNEDYDSPKSKDEKYLNKSVDTNSSDVSKYDGDLNYPVEKDLRVNSDMIHQEPVDECDGSMNSPIQEFDAVGGDNIPSASEPPAQERSGIKQSQPPSGQMTLGQPAQTYGDKFGQPPSSNRLGQEFAQLIKQYGPDRVSMMFPSGQKGFEDSRTKGNYSIDAIKQSLSR